MTTYGRFAVFARYADDSLAVLLLGEYSTLEGAKRKADAINKRIERVSVAEGDDHSAWAYVMEIRHANTKADVIVGELFGAWREDDPHGWPLHPLRAS